MVQGRAPAGLERGSPGMQPRVRLGYRPWKGPLHPPLLRAWPLARISLSLVLGKKIFWIFLLFSLMSFLFHSAIIYFVAQVQGELGQKIPTGLARNFNFLGTGEAYQNFITLQGTVVMMLLALAGELLVGSDFRSGAMPFYLSKPIGRTEYFLGKFGACFGLTALITLVPAIVLFVEFGAFSESFAYYADNLRTLRAIILYGLIMSIVPPVLLLGMAALLKRMVAIVLAWGGLFAFLPLLAAAIRNILSREGGTDPWAWQLLDIWSDLRWISGVLFGIEETRYGARWPWAALVLVGACALSLWAFWRKVKAVEVVR
jgi:ABC-2 type transport system permease protein